MMLCSECGAEMEGYRSCNVMEWVCPWHGYRGQTSLPTQFLPVTEALCDNTGTPVAREEEIKQAGFPAIIRNEMATIAESADAWLRERTR